MADRYVNPAVASSGSGITAWVNAYKTLKEATDAAAAGEKIYFANGTADVITVNTTYVLAAGVQVISTSDTTNSPPTTYAAGASVTSTTSGVDIIVQGQGALFGVTLAPATAGTSLLTLCSTDDDILYCEDCTFQTPSNTASSIILGSDGTRLNAELKTKRCTWLFGASASGITISARWTSISDVFCSSGTVPTVLLGPITTNNTETIIHGADLSAVSTTLAVGQSNGPAVVKISSSSLHASVTPLGSTTSGAGTTITLFDCSYDNAGTRTGTLFYHENHLGSTSISLAIYANDGLLFDGTNRCSWVVDGKAAATFDQPYESPWLDYYNSDISTSVTPYLECVRDGSATAYTDAEVWSEFSYRDTANSAVMAFATNRRGPLASAASQTSSSLTGSDWTGENATAWFGKLDAPAAFTADEIAYMRVRVCVAGNNTIYVDPQIRF